jgi:hypothetical protein
MKRTLPNLSLLKDVSVENLVARLEPLAENQTDVVSLVARNGAYVFVGEDHYEQEKRKMQLAAEINKMAAGKEIDLYVEQEENSSAVESAIEGLSNPETRPESTGVPEEHSSLVALLQSSAHATFFAATPEDMQGDAPVSITATRALELLVLMRSCSDLRRERAIFTLNAVVQTAERLLGVASMTAQRFAGRGLIDSALLPFVDDYLKKHMSELHTELNKQLARPLAYATRDALPLKDSSFTRTVVACVHAHHVVTDAVFVTSVRSRRASGAPKMIVAGLAHVATIRAMLAGQPAPGPATLYDVGRRQI